MADQTHPGQPETHQTLDVRSAVKLWLLLLLVLFVITTGIYAAAQLGLRFILVAYEVPHNDWLYSRLGWKDYPEWLAVWACLLLFSIVVGILRPRADQFFGRWIQRLVDR